MSILRFAPIFMFFTLLTGQSLALPGQVNATDCCSCSNPYGNNCKWRGSTLHCPECLAGDSGFFQAYVPTSNTASGFNAVYEPLSFTLPTNDLSYGMVALVREGNRRIGNLTSRLLAGAEFRLKAWCPGALDKSI